MRLILDDQDISDGSPANAAEALDLARTRCGGSGRVIVDIFLDDTRLEDQQLDPEVMASLQGTTLRCISADPWELVRDTLEQADGALDQIAVLQSQIADQLQAGETSEALEALRENYELWNQIQFGVEHGVALIGIDLEQVRREYPAANQAITDLTNLLREMRNSLESSDWVGLSDVLGYEMGPVTELWRDLIQELIRRIDAAQTEH